MKIGIDIDGTLTDIYRFFIDYGCKFSYKRHLNGIINVEKMEVEDIFNCDKETTHKFWHENLKFYRKRKYTREFAPEIIRKLKKQGNEIHIITARNEDERKWTTKWLKENRISYDTLVMTKKKLEYCREQGIDLMIEDNFDNLNKISAEIPVLCIDNVWNKNLQGDNITRCYGWYDVYEKIEVSKK